MQIALILPKHRLAAWHLRLTEALVKEHAVNVFMDEQARPYPRAVRAWLRAERLLSRQRRPAWAAVAVEALPHSGEFDDRGFEAVVDLSERVPPLPKSVSIRYNGSTDSMMLIRGLLGRQTPHLTVCSEGTHDVLAESVPSVGNKSQLGRGLQVSFGRCISLVERVLRSGPRSQNPAPGTMAPAVSPRLPAHIGRFVGAAATKIMFDKRLPKTHWSVALRRDGGPLVPVADDGRRFYADPFLYSWRGRTFLFVEDFPFAASKAAISAAEVVGDRLAASPVPVLERPYHLSYPFVLGDAGAMYMLPEAWQSNGLELYRAVEFPWKWELDRVLIDGVALVDATPLFYQNRWWLFASSGEYGTTHHDELLIFHSDKLTGPWRPHSGNPVKSDCRSARPAGRIVRRGDALFRPAQDCEDSYGAGIAWHQIVELSPTRFREIEIARVMAPPELGFDGHHTFDEIGPLQAIDVKPIRGSVTRCSNLPHVLQRVSDELDLAMQAISAAAGSSSAPPGHGQAPTMRVAERVPALSG